MNEAEETRPTPVLRGLGRRGMSPTMAAVVLIVVIALVGGAGFAGLNAISGGGGTTRTSCTPANAPGCGGHGRLNDVQLFLAYQPGFGETAVQVSLAQSIPATVSLGGGEAASSFSVAWGDGTTTTQTSSTFSHSYSGIGSYVLYATAVVNGVTHTGSSWLVPVTVIPTIATTASGDFPTLSTSFSNGTSNGIYPWVSQGGQVTVTASYSALPTASGFTAGSPQIVASAGATQVSVSNSTTSATGTFSFAAPGVYHLTMVGPVTGPQGTVYQNYTWGVFVGATGAPLQCANDCKGTGTVGATSPHPGSLYAYEVAPGGATSLDPAVDYETVGGEILENVYETLVNYNGSSTASFVPVLSTCVPGPAASGPNSCQAQYGSDLVQGNYWTFPIDPNARFFDSGTGASWGVYPSDVMFSIARTMMWLQTPSQYVYNGWIIGQSLLPYGNAHWDGGVHAPWNNTPQNVLGSMLVNDSAYCPSAAMTGAHGCITFDVAGSGVIWPEFLEFLADEAGASVVPCGWFTAQGAGLPGFMITAAHGDGPCTLPGGVTSTNTSAFQSYVSGASPTLYDPIIALGASSPYQPQPQVRWNAVGSGPYYIVSVNQGQGYILKPNPAYTQPNCANQPNCFPAPGTYVKDVYVFWEPNSVTGVEQYIAGQSDYSVILPTDIPTVLNLVQKGKVSLFSLPTLNLFLQGFYYHFDPAATQTDSSLTTNIPGDFFSYVGMREFLAQAFPYNTFITQYNAEDGIPFIQGVGGAIPQYLGNYYPTNITWPGLNATTGAWQDPNTNPSAQGSAAWWWAEITNPANTAYYDPEAVACKTTTCVFPMVSEQGAAPWDEGVAAWSAEVKTITGGAIDFSTWDPTFSQIVQYSTVAPGTSPFTSAIDGWLPDYPDPTDYMAPYYYPDGSYTYSAALNETFVADEFGGDYMDASCGHAADNFADLVYWAGVAGPTAVIPNDCQGIAYAVMTWAADQAASMTVGPGRVLFYNLVEHIANGLALYVYEEQQVLTTSDATWITPGSFDTNVVSPGQLWFFWTGTGVVG